MFNKLLNEKNRHILINVIFSLSLISALLLVIAILKNSALNVLIDIFRKIGNTPALAIILIIFTGIYGAYLIYKIVSQKVIIKGTIVYLTSSVNLIQIFHHEKVAYYFSRLAVEKVLFIKKFIFIFCYTGLMILSIYSLIIIVKSIWKIVRIRIADFEAPKINNSEVQQTIGLYYLDFEYNKNLSYYVTYEGNGKIIKEDLTSNKLLCLAGELLKDVEYEIKLYSLGKIKAKFTALEAQESVKLLLSNKPTELQERVAYYYHYSPKLIECYIALLQVFDKMFKRLLINSPEVIIVESLNKKIIFAKIYLDKENIVIRLNANPFLLEEEFNVINAFEEDCMYPTKFIVRQLNDVDYLKSIVDKIKSMKRE